MSLVTLVRFRVEWGSNAFIEKEMTLFEIRHRFPFKGHAHGFPHYRPTRITIYTKLTEPAMEYIFTFLKYTLHPKHTHELHFEDIKMSSDIEMEKKINDKGLNAPRLNPDMIAATIVKEEYHVFPNSSFTVCLLTLVNDYNVIGSSACASPENYNKEIGEEIAKRNAVQEIWALEGYLLKEKLHNMGERKL